MKKPAKTPEGKILLEKMKEAKKKADVSFWDTDQAKQYRKLWDDMLNNDAIPWDERMKKLDEISSERDEAYEKYEKAREPLYNEYRKLHREFENKYKREARETIRRGESDNEEANKIGRQCDEIMRKYADSIYTEQKAYEKSLAKLYKKMRSEGKVAWTIQPIHTLKAGPFTDVNDLVRQLIKEGFKNINLIACNPGRHTLAKDILDTPGVKIHHSNTSLLAESATYYNSGDIFVESAFLEIDKSLMNTQKHLLSICEASGICYNDDEYLDECVAFFESGEAQQVLVEGVLATAWAKLKALVAKALGFIVSIFKKLIELVAGLIRKIKDFFKKIFGSDRVSNKFAQPVTSGAILIENARINKTKVTSWEDMQKNVVSACEKITKKIEETERKQTHNLQELERYADKQAKTVNESSDPNMDKILALFV